MMHLYIYNYELEEAQRIVLILVVMDDALVQQNVVFWLFEGIVRQKSAPEDFVLTNIMYLFCVCKITNIWLEWQKDRVNIWKMQVGLDKVLKEDE